MSSGVAVGVPGTVGTWDAAVDRFGTLPLPVVLAPSIAIHRAHEAGKAISEPARVGR